MTNDWLSTTLKDYRQAVKDGEFSWQEEALCAQTDPELFFPETGGLPREAKKICGTCPVKQKCLDYAITHNETEGIWGGLSAIERRRLRYKLLGPSGKGRPRRNTDA